MTDSIQTEKIISQFLNSLKTSKSKTDYMSLIRNLCDFTGKDICQIDRDDAERYIGMLIQRRKEGTLAQSTINVRAARLHSIYNYIIQNNPDCGIEENPFARIQLPQIGDSIDPKKIPGREQLEWITDAAKADRQLYLAVSMVKRCAFTVGELCSIRTNSIFQDKNGNYGVKFIYRSIERWVKLPEDVVELMDQLMRERGCVSQYLFCNKKGNQLRIRDMERLYKKYVPESCPYTLQDIRNAAVTYMLKSGAPDKMVAEYINIDYSWITRYNVAVKELDLAPVDYVTPEMYQQKSREQQLEAENMELRKEIEELKSIKMHSLSSIGGDRL